METIEKEVKPAKIKRKISAVLVIVLICMIGTYFWNESKFETTDNAYVETHSVQISPKVSGQVVNVYVTDNQKVKEGDLIAEIDDSDYRTKLAELNAKYDMTVYKQKNAKANYSAVNSELKLAQRDLDRYISLYRDGAASKQDYDRAQAKFDAVKAKQVQADEDLLSSKNNKVADAELKQLAALKRQAELNLSYTKIYAPQDGYVTNRNVEKGAYVQVGQPLLVVVPEKIWVVANFKENQLQKMHVGQFVEIKIDTYPQKRFRGKIDSIQRSSGAKASLFPPENAVGSFVKVVQRIPVKIVFDERIDYDKYMIVPGMSVEPRVRVK